MDLANVAVCLFAAAEANHVRALATGIMSQLRQPPEYISCSTRTSPHRPAYALSSYICYRLYQPRALHSSVKMKNTYWITRTKPVRKVFHMTFSSLHSSQCQPLRETRDELWPIPLRHLHLPSYRHDLVEQYDVQQ